MSKILTFFVDPLFVFFLLMLVMALFLKLTAKGRFFFFIVIVTFYGVSVPVVVDPLFVRLEGEKKLIIPKGQAPLDAAVVLTGMVSLSPRDERFEEFGGAVDRILKGMDMVRQNQIKYLVISGGSGELAGASLKEANILKNFAIRFGINGQKILIEPESRNTRESALMTKGLLDTHNIKNIGLITSAFHMKRALGCFKAVGLSPQPIPVDYQTSLPDKKDFRNYFPNTDTLARFSLLVHETVGVVVYGLNGYAVY